MKNKLIAAIVAVACLIPSGVAYASYRRTQSAPVDTSNAVSISIDDPTGKNYTYIKERDGDTGDRLIQYFLSMKDRAQAISSLPDSLSGEQFYMVTISAAVKSVTYEYYFSIDPSTCYFVAPDGMPYKINEEDAKEFITTEYAESLYKEAEMPKLTLSHSVEVTPDEASWLYKNFTGGYVEADTSSMVYANIESYDIEGGLDLSFDVQPDFCSVKVTDATETALYDGMLENLSEFTLDKTKQILVEVNAKWYEDSSRAFYGNLIYNFASYVSAPAEFYAGMNLVDAGKFVAITALNVTKPENITMTSNMPGVQDITFFSETDSIAVGLLPIDLDTPTGTYDLTFTYGGTIAHVTLTVQNNGVNASYYSVDEAVVASARSSAALLQFEGATKEIMATASPTRYFSGSFLDGMTGFYTLQRGFGRDIYVNGATSPTYRKPIAITVWTIPPTPDWT